MKYWVGKGLFHHSVHSLSQGKSGQMSILAFLSLFSHFSPKSGVSLPMLGWDYYTNHRSRKWLTACIYDNLIMVIL